MFFPNKLTIIEKKIRIDLPTFGFLYRYCNQVLCKEIDECVTLLLQELVSFQERIYQKDPVRAKARRRLVMGLREVTKHMKLNKIKCVIISPNCEKIQSKGINLLLLKCFGVYLV